MRLTKLAHACVRLTADDRTIVLDPGGFSDAASALQGAHGVLVTHEHVDHIDGPAVQAALDADPDLHLWAPAAVAGGFGDRATAVTPGEAFIVAGFEVHAYGGQHALIHTSVPMCANVGFRIAAGGASVYHPGDSYAVPTEAVSAVLVPTSGPWLSLGAAADYLTAVRAPQAFQIHDALLSELGAAVTERILGGIVEPFGVGLTHLSVGESVEI